VEKLKARAKELGGDAIMDIGGVEGGAEERAGAGGYQDDARDG